MTPKATPPRALWAVLVTCEHASRRVPRAHRRPFEADPALARRLLTHEGFDIGALPLARRLARRLDAPLVAAGWTRLLVDANRSPEGAAVFGPAGRRLPLPERQRLLERAHGRHWARVERAFHEVRGPGKAAVVHLAVHTFTPVFRNRRRSTDLGLLYDPSRSVEVAVVALLHRSVRAALPELRLHRNRPYRGTTDGLPTALRRRFPDEGYAGIELELSQALAARLGVVGRLVDALGEALTRGASPG
jgi:predicted N-formylglutamate amidohydrolase